MYDALTTATIRARAYADLGLELPPEAARLTAIAKAVTDAANGDPLDGLDFDAITEKNATRVLHDAALKSAVKEGMQKLAMQVNGHLGGRMMRTFNDDIDRAADELRPGFLDAAAVVIDGINAGLSREILDSPEQILRAGPVASGLYHRTRDALAHLQRVRSFFAGGIAEPVGAQVAKYVRLTDSATVDTLDIAESIFTGTGLDDRFLAVYSMAGVVPALNTSTQANDVVSSSAALRFAEEQERKDAEIAAAQERAASWARLGVGA
jgi:hypothetical protein